MNRMAEQIKFDEGNEQSPVNRLNQILLERNLLLAEMEPDAMSNEDFCPFCHGQNKLCKINFPDDATEQEMTKEEVACATQRPLTAEFATEIKEMVKGKEITVESNGKEYLFSLDNMELTSHYIHLYDSFAEMPSISELA